MKKVPQSSLEPMTKEQQIQIRKLQKEQGIKPTSRPTSTETKVAALEAKLGVSSQPGPDNAEENWGETSKGTMWGGRKRKIMQLLTRHWV